MVTWNSSSPGSSLLKLRPHPGLGLELDTLEPLLLGEEVVRGALLKVELVPVLPVLCTTQIIFHII